MKRIAFVLSLVLTMFAVLSCGGSGAESVASYSNEIRVDDPMTFRKQMETKTNQYPDQSGRLI